MGRDATSATPIFRPTRFAKTTLAVFALALAGSLPAFAAEPSWWTDLKSQCGLPSSLVYNDWDGNYCPNRQSGSGGGAGTGARGSDYEAERRRAEERERQQQLEDQRRREEAARRAREAAEREAAFIRDRDDAAGRLKGSGPAARAEPRGANPSGTELRGLTAPATPTLRDGGVNTDPSVVDLRHLGDRPGVVDPRAVRGTGVPSASPGSSAPAANADATRIIGAMNALAQRLGWSADQRARLDSALRSLQSDGDPGATGPQIRQAWQDVLNRADGGDLAVAAANGDGPGIFSIGAGRQTRYEDCALFALANATGLPYGVVVSRAGELIRDAEWRSAAQRANPQRTIERGGLIGGEVVMLAEAFGRAEVVPSSDFTKTLKQGRAVMVNVVPENGDTRSGHQIVLSRTFQRGGETWFEAIDSNQGPQRRLFVSANELNTILQENGVAFQAEPGRTPRFLGAGGTP